jgi:pimeloyl-ACP methyl ester carboxylesterase
MTTFVLVPGFWLGAWAWHDVTTALREAGHDVHPLTLTGVGERAHLATPEVDLDTHTDDVVRLIEEHDLHNVVLVGHSGGGMPVSQAADRIPERIAQVVYVDSGPLPDGMSQFDTTEPAEQERLRAEIGAGHLIPPPPWDPTADPVNLAGLDEAALATLRSRSTPHPLGAATQPVHRKNHAKVRNALIACVIPIDQVREMIAQGHPFFAEFQGGEVRGLDTGHWPMLSEPAALAKTLSDLAAPIP